MTDHYATLGVPRTAAPDEIKRAFRKLASQHHPDKGGDTAKFQQIQAAYDTLGDADKRAAYDNPAPQFSGFGPGPGAHFNMHDIFGQMFGGQNPFGQQRRPNHVRMSISITLADVARGGSKTVNVGTSAGSSTVKIEIPKGIEDGDNVQYSGIAPNGMDLVVQFRVQPDPAWARQGSTVITEKKVSVWDLILGAEIQITGLAGQELVAQIPSATQPGSLLRLRGKGLPDRDGGAGDILVKLQAFIPTPVPESIVAALQQAK
jgi:DnaJ-class molecular chaperone